MKVLFVDDEPDILEQAEMFLERSERLEVETAVSAEEGLQSLADDGFDAVVSDYKMPEMDGLDFLQAIRENDDDIPFVMVTGKGSRNIAERALKIGSDVYLKKKGDPGKQFQVIEDTVIRIIKDREDEQSGKYLIAWIEKKKGADSTELKKDLEDLSATAGFRITDIKVQDNPVDSNPSEIMRTYTDSYPEVPEIMASEAKEWKRMLQWDRRVVDVDVKIEGTEERKKTKILGEIEDVI